LTTSAASLVALLGVVSRRRRTVLRPPVRNFLALLMTILISTMMVVIRRLATQHAPPRRCRLSVLRSSSGRGGARQRDGLEFFYLALFARRSSVGRSAHDRHAPDLGHRDRPGPPLATPLGLHGLARFDEVPRSRPAWARHRARAVVGIF